MESTVTFGRLVRNLLLLSLLGFVAVLFAKPLLTAAAVVLALALVGFVVWLPIHSLVFGRRAPLRPGLDRGRELSAGALAGLAEGCRQAGRLRRRFAERLCDWTVRARPLVLEVGSGAVLGGLLVWAYTGTLAESEALATGVVVGAAAGLVVVWSRREPVEPAAEE